MKYPPPGRISSIGIIAGAAVAVLVATALFVALAWDAPGLLRPAVFGISCRFESWHGVLTSSDGRRSRKQSSPPTAPEEKQTDRIVLRGPKDFDDAMNQALRELSPLE